MRDRTRSGADISWDVCTGAWDFLGFMVHNIPTEQTLLGTMRFKINFIKREIYEN